MDRARLTDVLLHAGWLLFFAGIPFSGLSAPGILLILIHWAVARPQLPPAALANPRTAAAVKWYRIAVFGLLAAYAAGLAVAASPVDALGAGLGNGLLLLFGAVYAFRLEVANPGWWRRYLWVVPLSGAVHAGIGIAQYLESGTRVMGVHSNPNAYATVLLAALYLGVAALVQYGGRRRWLAVPYTAVMAAGLLVTGSRGAWVGALAGAAVFGALALRGVWRANRRRALAAGAAGLVLAGLAVGAVYAAADAPMQRRMASIFDLNANQDRVVLYQTMWDLISDNPVLGVGVNNIKHRFAEYQGDRGGPVFDIAHNYFLQSLGETGIVGTVFLLLLWFVWLYYGLPPVGAPAPRLLLYSLAVALLVRDQFDGALTIFYLAFLLNWLGGTLTAAAAERRAET